MRNWIEWLVRSVVRFFGRQSEPLAREPQPRGFSFQRVGFHCHAAAVRSLAQVLGMFVVHRNTDVSLDQRQNAATQCQVPDSWELTRNRLNAPRRWHAEPVSGT